MVQGREVHARVELGGLGYYTPMCPQDIQINSFTVIQF